MCGMVRNRVTAASVVSKLLFRLFFFNQAHYLSLWQRQHEDVYFKSNTTQRSIELFYKSAYASVSQFWYLTEIYDELSASGEEPDLLSVLTVLASTFIPGLPPGGGIQSK